MKHPMKATLLAAGLLSLCAPAFADTVMISGSIDGSEPTFNNPDTSSTALTGYDTYEFVVNADGRYDIHSFYAGDVASDANLDGFILLYEGSFDPLNPGASLAFDDDSGAGDIPSLGAFDGVTDAFRFHLLKQTEHIFPAYDLKQFGIDHIGHRRIFR